MTASMIALIFDARAADPKKGWRRQNNCSTSAEVTTVLGMVSIGALFLL
jgi:hypothetical protein